MTSHYRFYLIMLIGLFTLSIVPGSAYGRLRPQTAQERIVFQSYRDGNWEIYVMNTGGSQQVNLSNHIADDVDPSWSPDGSRIAFTSWRDGNAEIYVMNADGSGQRNLTHNSANDMAPAWSPDGSKIVFQSNRSRYAHIYTMNADGTEVTFIPVAPPAQNPHWSPDGTRIVYDGNDTNNTDIYTVNIDGSNRTKLTDNPKDDWAPVWSPDGSKISYTSITPSGDTNIMSMNADGSGKTSLNNDSASDAVSTWSPDGTHLAFGSWRDGNHDIYTMRADGTGITRLTYDAHNDNAPDWSHLTNQSERPDLEAHPPLIAQNGQLEVTGITIAVVNTSAYATHSSAGAFHVHVVVAQEHKVVGRAYARIPDAALPAHTTLEMTEWCDAAVSAMCEPFDLLSSFDTPGLYTVEIQVDSTYVIAETDETNNDIFTSFFVGNGAVAPTVLLSPIVPDATAVEHISSIGGSVDIVTVSGSFAYVGEGSGLTILDVSNPTAPDVRSRMLLPQPIQDIQVTDNLAYIAAGYYGLIILDVSNPSAPFLRGHVDIPPSTSSVHVEGHFAYVGYPFGFIIFDVSDPAHPTERGYYYLDAYRSAIHHIDVVGTLVYLAADSTGLVIVDVTDPDHPVQRGVYRPTGTQFQAMDVQVTGSLAYVLDNVKGLYILNVSDPADPVEQGTYQEYFVKNIHVVGGLVYMSDLFDGLLVVDVSNPQEPQKYTSLDTAGGSSHVWISGEMAYLAAGSGGLQIIDIQNRYDFHVKGHYAVSGSIYSISLVNNRIYAGGGGAFDVKRRISSTRMQVFDVSNPTTPLLQGSVGPLGGLISVHGQPGTAYVSAQQELYGFDASNAGRIALRSRFDIAHAFGVDPTDCDLVGNLVYVTSRGGGLGIVDVSTPDRPVKLGHYPRTGNNIFHSVQVVGAHAYVPVGGAGLLIINVSDPTNPTLQGQYDLPDITSAHVVGTLAYIGSQNTLTIVDVSDSARPTLRGRYTAPEMLGSVWDVKVAYSLAYLALDQSGIWIIDIRNPTTPVLSGHYRTPGVAAEVQVRGDLIYIATGAGGLHVLRHTGSFSQAHVYLPLIQR